MRSLSHAQHGIVILEVLMAMTILGIVWLGIMQVHIGCIHALQSSCERIRLLSVVHWHVGMIQTGAMSAGMSEVSRDGYVLTVEEFRDESVLSVRWIVVRARRNGVSVQLITAIRRGSQ